MLKCHHVKSQRVQDFLEAFLMLPIKKRYLVVSKKKNSLFV